jgi:hypothetical protein
LLPSRPRQSKSVLTYGRHGPTPRSMGVAMLSWPRSVVARAARAVTVPPKTALLVDGRPSGRLNQLHPSGHSPPHTTVQNSSRTAASWSVDPSTVPLCVPLHFSIASTLLSRCSTRHNPVWRRLSSLVQTNHKWLHSRRRGTRAESEQLSLCSIRTISRASIWECTAASECVHPYGACGHTEGIHQAHLECTQ